jgi:hypothetical protein
MSHLQAAMDTIAQNDPDVQRIEKIGVGNAVVYVGRIGSMRQGRTEFPALVLKQHPDDGTLDLLVIFEAEDMIWEQRVRPWSEANPGHCWKPVADAPPRAADSEFASVVTTLGEMEKRVKVLEEDTEPFDGEGFETLNVKIKELTKQMYGDYNPPPMSMIEYLDGFDKRLTKIEKALKKEK